MPHVHFEHSALYCRTSAPVTNVWSILHFSARALLIPLVVQPWPECQYELRLLHYCPTRKRLKSPAFSLTNYRALAPSYWNLFGKKVLLHSSHVNCQMKYMLWKFHKKTTVILVGIISKLLRYIYSQQNVRKHIFSGTCVLFHHTL